MAKTIDRNGDIHDERGEYAGHIGSAAAGAPEMRPQPRDWGRADPSRAPKGWHADASEIERVAPGIIFVSGASHGGYVLSPERNREIPKPLRNPRGAYEEDLDRAVVEYVFPEETTASMDPDETREHAAALLREHFPDQWEQATGEAVSAEQSLVRRRQLEADSGTWRFFGEISRDGDTAIITVRKGGDDGVSRTVQVPAEVADQAREAVRATGEYAEIDADAPEHSVADEDELPRSSWVSYLELQHELAVKAERKARREFERLRGGRDLRAARNAQLAWESARDEARSAFRAHLDDSREQTEAAAAELAKTVRTPEEFRVALDEHRRAIEPWLDGDGKLRRLSPEHLHRRGEALRRHGDLNGLFRRGSVR